MAFLSKFGGILRQTVGKQVDSQLSPASPSIFQAIRWMSSSKLFIGGVSYSTDDTSLREAFAQYGDVVDARVIVDRETGRSRGFGFVTYTSSEEASSAIQALDGQELHGRRVRVAYATDRDRGGGGSYSGGAGYGGGGYSGNAGYGGGSGGYGTGGSGGYGGNYGSGGYGGSGTGGQSGVDGYGTGGANYGGSYGAGSFGTGGSPGGYNAGGFGAGSGASDASFGDGANFGVSGGAAGNVAGDTSFAKSGFEEGSGLGYSGGSDQFGAGATSGFEDKAGDFEVNEPVDRADRDEDETDDFAKRA